MFVFWIFAFSATHAAFRFFLSVKRSVRYADLNEALPLE